MGCPPWGVNDRDLVSVHLNLSRNAANTSGSLFGSTLALHAIEFRAARIVARDLQQKLKEKLRSPVMARISEVKNGR
jgi:hypothetical protein